MIDTRKITWGYFLCFMSVYVFSILYSASPAVLDVQWLPQSSYTSEVNMTTNNAMNTFGGDTVFAGFGLLAVGVIVVAAYGCISVFSGY